MVDGGLMGLVYILIGVPCNALEIQLSHDFPAQSWHVVAHSKEGNQPSNRDQGK